MGCRVSKDCVKENVKKLEHEYLYNRPIEKEIITKQEHEKCTKGPNYSSEDNIPIIICRDNLSLSIPSERSVSNSSSSESSSYGSSPPEPSSSSSSMSDSIQRDNISFRPEPFSFPQNSPDDLRVIMNLRNRVPLSLSFYESQIFKCITKMKTKKLMRASRSKTVHLIISKQARIRS